MEVERQFAQELKSINAVTRDLEKSSACFDCSICLDNAYDPVVTLCGHLFCWPCIYKWLQFQGSSLTSGSCTQCPICKTEISDTSLIPLYGRGQSLSEPDPDEKAKSLEMTIPSRPTAFHRQPHNGQPRHNADSEHSVLNVQNSYMNYGGPSSAVSSPGSSTSTAVCEPVVGMFGEMVYARVFRNSQSLYAYPNSYCLAGRNSPRLRRLEMEAHKSLNRVTFFLFCCFLLCLLLF